MTGANNSLGLDIRLQGRAAKGPAFGASEMLTAEDFAILNDERGGGGGQSLKKLRQRHHAVARLVAEGWTETDAGVSVGYTAAYISTLKNDPAFRELVSFYKRELGDQYFGMHETLAALGKDAGEELLNRLEEKPDEFTVGQLLEVVKAGADRTGHGPTSSTTVDVKHGLADRMQAGRARARQALLDLDPVTEMKDVTPDE